MLGLMQVGSSVSKVDVHLSVNKNPSVSENHNTEVTVFAKNHVIRATDTRSVNALGYRTKPATQHSRRQTIYSEFFFGSDRGSFALPASRKTVRRCLPDFFVHPARSSLSPALSPDDIA